MLGSQRLGGVAGVLLGSVSGQVAGHAEVPVVVVHGPRQPAYGQVVAGVDDSPECRPHRRPMPSRRRPAGKHAAGGAHLEAARPGGLTSGTSGPATRTFAAVRSGWHGGSWGEAKEARS
ncbi:universal stress protein [Nonomuraea sp. NPDC048826]|uniref:universal stress protein n=1 Tax=Nonomuraea sp. NPDC048826 TaxID=3364347 RepID=UPI0037135313